MDKLLGKVAVVTGASSGIGAAIAEALVENGMKVVGLARRADRLQAMERKLTGHKGKLYPIKTDLRKEADIVQAFQWIEDNLGAVQVLVNNAGTLNLTNLPETPTDVWREMYELNVIALQMCTQEGLKSMKAHNINDGYIINISSYVAHMSSAPRPGMGTYFVSKKAVNAISEALRQELESAGSKIRVTTISPSLCETELLNLAGLNIPRTVFDRALQPSDIADTVLYLLKLKPYILISELVIRPTAKITDQLFTDSRRQ